MIYIIDDDDEMRQSLADALKRAKYTVEQYASAVDFIAQTKKVVAPSVILLDMQMPELSGLDLQEYLKKNNLLVPIIFISGQSHPQQIIDGLHNGAFRFLLKPFDLSELMLLVNDAISIQLKKGNLNAAFLSLTPREREVFVALAKGRLVKQIALDREVSESVIKLHKSRVMEKLEVKTLQALASIYRELGLE